MGLFISLTDTWRWKLGTRPGIFISGNTHKLGLLFSAGETASTFSFCSRQPGPMKGIAKTPDHDIFYHLARVYATNHLSMLDQTQCKRWYFEVCSWHLTLWDAVLWDKLLGQSQRGMQYFELCSWQITVLDAVLSDKSSPMSLLPAIKISCQNPFKPYFAAEIYSMFF